MSLRHRAVSAFGWTGTEQLAQALSGGLVHLVLARLLVPDDFALLAMLAVFLELGRSLVDSGFTAALIQSREVSKTDLSSVFFFNLLAALLLSALLALLAPQVAVFYRQPLLRSMLTVLSLRLVLDALGTVHSTILHRRLDIKAQARVRLPATVIGGVTGVTMALNGFGAWALVGQVLAQALSRSVFFWLSSDWRPTWTLKVDSLRRLVPFGSKLLAAAMIDKLATNVYLLVIGRRFPAASLGYYYQARRYQRIPSLPLVRALNQVLLPLFSGVQTNDVLLRRLTAKGTRLLAFVYFPVMIGLICVAEPLIHVLLTAKWLPAVPYFQLFCLASLPFPLYALNLSLVKAKGESGSVLRLEFVKRLIDFSALLVTFRWGIGWIIVGQIASAISGLVLTTYYTQRLVGFGLGSLVRQAGPYLAFSGAMGILVYQITGLGLQPVSLVLSQVAAGVLFYSSAAFVLRLRAARELLELIRIGRTPDSKSSAGP